jgi:capsular polysaccharide transport system permease protein
MTHDTSIAMPAAIALDEQERAVSRTRHWGRRALRSPLFWIVGMPVLIAALYLFLIAAPQYRSEAQFVIRGLDSPRVEANGFGQLLGVTPTLDPSAKATYILIEYLRSRRPERVAGPCTRRHFL